MGHPRILARVEQLLAGLGQPRLSEPDAAAIERQLSEVLGEEERLLVLGEDESGDPTAIRINIPGLAVGITAVAGGYAQGGVLGAATALATIWALGDVTTDLPPGAAVVAWVLVEAPDHTLPRAELETTWRRKLASLGVSKPSDDLDAILQTLAMSEVLALDGDEITLLERAVKC